MTNTSFAHEFDFFDSCLEKDSQTSILCKDFVKKFKAWELSQDMEISEQQKRPHYVKNFNNMLSSWLRSKKWDNVVSKKKIGGTYRWTGLKLEDNIQREIKADELIL